MTLRCLSFSEQRRPPYCPRQRGLCRDQQCAERAGLGTPVTDVRLLSGPALAELVERVAVGCPYPVRLRSDEGGVGEAGGAVQLAEVAHEHALELLRVVVARRDGDVALLGEQAAPYELRRRGCGVGEPARPGEDGVVPGGVPQFDGRPYREALVVGPYGLTVVVAGGVQSVVDQTGRGDHAAGGEPPPPPRRPRQPGGVARGPGGQRGGQAAAQAAGD